MHEPTGVHQTLVRSGADLTPYEVQFLDLSGLTDLVAEPETWTFLASNQALSFATHGTFRYFGKFPPPVARRLISAYTVPGDTVVDLMAGSGTTGVEALLSGRTAILNDVNPFSALVARVKTTRIATVEARAALQQVRLVVEEGLAQPVAPSGLRNTDHWFLPETQTSLGAIRGAIDMVTRGEVRDLLLVALAAVVRKVSRATTQQGRLFLDATTAQLDALPAFLKAADKLIDRAASLPEGLVTVTSEDVRELAVRSRAPLVVLHPPYFNAYKYSSVNSLEMAWLGIDRAAVRRREIREFFKTAKPDKLQDFLSDMTAAATRAVDWLAPGGRLALMLGDARLGGEHVRVVRPLLDALSDRLVVERLIMRVPKFTEASWAASQRRTTAELGASKMYDFIVVLRPAHG
ncbi:DNA methyltransferase [Modestobacter sp. VKM Ac-2986]|uniref:DNA methyltransferase n=1 Tax=Modestobacter sp. VKM Ac-2986 TaxID=3004140 RepID=UPI0022AAD280|nr:DNA methyltransferase [Modestobacter sp. VKM Ac-2986]